jgi:hypothetical protein
MSPPSSSGTTNTGSFAAGLENAWGRHEQSSKTSNEMGCSVQGKLNRPGQFRIGRQGQRAHKSWNVVFILSGSWLIIPFLQGKDGVLKRHPTQGLNDF